MTDWITSAIHDAMTQAIGLASDAGSSGNYPVAAVVFDRDGIIACAASTLIKTNDPSAHPEMIAIRQACEKKQSRYIQGAYLATTLEPCPMCASAAVWARMDGIAYATNQNDAEVLGHRLLGTVFTFRQIKIPCSDIIKAGDPPLEVFKDINKTAMLEVYEKFAISLNK